MKLEPIRKMQSGGGMPPFTYYTPLGLTGAAPAEASPSTPTISSKASSGDDDGLSDKDVLKMINSIDALPSDTNQIINSLSWIYKNDNLFTNGRINATNVSTRYLQALRQMKNANFSKSEYDNALETVQSNGGLNEIAISGTGRVVVQDEEGSIKQVTAEEYLKNPEKYATLKNSDLLHIRAYNDEMAGQNDILKVVKNGVGMSAINKSIQDTINKLGTTTISKEGYAHKKENNIIQGIEHLEQIAREGADLSGMGLDGIYKTGLLNKNQMQQATEAIKYIASTLDSNAMTLLEIKSGNSSDPRRGALDLIASMVTSQLSNTVDTNLNYEEKLTGNLTNGGSGSGEGSRGDMKQLDAIASGIATVQRDYILNPGSNYQFVAPQSNWWSAPQDVSTGKELGLDTLDSVLTNAGYGSLVMQNSIYFGSDKVDPTTATSVLVDPHEGVAEVWLPYVQTANGGIAPNFELLHIIEKIEGDLSKKGNISELERRQAYKDAGIEQFWNVIKDPKSAGEQGLLRPFLALNGATADETGRNGVVTSNNKAVEELKGDERERWKNFLNATINSPNKNGGKKGNYDVDSWWEHNWFWLFDNTADMYRGTILMPLAGDRISTATRTGNINLPKTMFDARNIHQEGSIRSNWNPMGPTNF